MTLRKHKVGSRVGELTLLKMIPGQNKTATRQRIEQRWLCRCSCGVVKEIRAANINSGAVVSCGHIRSKAAAERMHRRHEEASYARHAEVKPSTPVWDELTIAWGTR